MGLATSTTSFECTIGDGLAHIMLNQPDRGNPIDGEFCRAFSLCMAGARRAGRRARSSSARAAGCSASWRRPWCRWCSRATRCRGTIKAWTADLHAAIARMVRMRAPVVVAVHGNVAGGSVSLMAAADLRRHGGDGANIVGLCQDRVQSGQRIDNHAHAPDRRCACKAVFLLGETLDANTALSLGLVDHVVPDNAVQDEAQRIARELAAGPTEAYGAIKRLFSETLDRSLESQLEQEAQTLAAISRTADAREGVKAFVEKRKPAFLGM